MQSPARDATVAAMVAEQLGCEGVQARLRALDPLRALVAIELLATLVCLGLRLGGR